MACSHPVNTIIIVIVNGARKSSSMTLPTRFYSGRSPVVGKNADMTTE